MLAPLAATSSSSPLLDETETDNAACLSVCVWTTSMVYPIRTQPVGADLLSSALLLWCHTIIYIFCTIYATFFA